MPKEKFNDHYLHAVPHPQNAIDIFQGEWSSQLPNEFLAETGGHADLFEDQRFIWASNNGLSFENKTVLELGPLEGGHSWIIEKLGAKETLAIEAHERAFLKCLIVKEITGMTKTKFMHGDFNLFLTDTKRKFDICVASGVLYHSTDPVHFLERICGCSKSLLLWSHYFDNQVIHEQDELLNRFDKPESKNYKGYTIPIHPFCYSEEIEYGSFCGGLEKKSRWLEKAGIENILRLNGFEITATGFDHPHHPNGPAIAIIAHRSVSL